MTQQRSWPTRRQPLDPPEHDEDGQTEADSARARPDQSTTHGTEQDDTSRDEQNDPNREPKPGETSEGVEESDLP